MTDRTMLCRRCGEKQPSSEMRYFETAKNLMCTTCIDEVRNPKTKPLTKREDKKKERFKCGDCKHTIMIKEGFNKLCSFCGKTNLISQEWNSDLDNLISDSTQSIYDN